MIEIDDLEELDSFVTLLEPTTPKDIKIYTSENFPNMDTLKEKPKLMIKSFKFDFFEDNQTPSHQKYQEFSRQMTMVYTKAVKHIKDSIFEEPPQRIEPSRSSTSKYSKKGKFEGTKKQVKNRVTLGLITLGNTKNNFELLQGDSEYR